MSDSGIRARAVSGGGPFPVPRSKFGCPAVPVRAIARRRLAKVLAQPDWRVGLVTGGPATGKTVAVAQWFETLDPIAREWVTLDADDDRPERFWLTFALALGRAVPAAFAQVAEAATDVHRLPSGFLSRLLTAWSAVTDPLVIVLEDVHHLQSPEITEDLGFVVEHLPRRSRMLLTSRIDPQLPILFPRELVTESASRMLTYALMLGLAGQVAEAHAWLQRAQIRISDEPQAQAKDLATLDALRLLTFAVTAGAGDEIDAGRRAVEAGLDSGVVGARSRMNLVRGYLLTDQPGEAGSVLRAGSPGDEIAALVLAPALAARIALRHGRLSEAEREATASLHAAGAFGLGTHLGVVDAHLALAGVRIDRNELAEASAAFRRLGRSFRSTRLPASTTSCSSWRRPGWPPRWTISTTCSPSCARPASSSIIFCDRPCGAWSMGLPPAGTWRQARQARLRN
jgi:hypothetical protein